VLIANTGAQAVDADVTILFEDRAAVTRTVAVGPTNRFGFDVTTLFSKAAGRKYGVLVEAQDASAPLIVERATYWNGGATFWGAGANAVALPLP
jgi:hypothetical protein